MEERVTTHNAGWIVRRDDDILQPELMQIESVPGELRVGTVETLTAAHELDEQSDGTFYDRLRLGEQGLVLSSRGGTLRKERASRGALTFCTAEEICSRCWEWPAINRECSTALDVEARVREWAEGRESRRG